jgi:hypothetical protein
MHTHQKSSDPVSGRRSCARDARGGGIGLHLVDVGLDWWRRPKRPDDIVAKIKQDMVGVLKTSDCAQEIPGPGSRAHRQHGEDRERALWLSLRFANRRSAAIDWTSGS